MNTNPEPPASPAKVPARRLGKLLPKLILLGFTFFLMLLVGELLVRLFLPPLIMPRWVENGPHGIRRQLGNVRGEIVGPQYRHKVSTNSRGYRGTREYSIAKPTNVFRVVVLGDSVVDGYGVEDGKTFSALLETKLSARRPVEVLNMGIAGFSNAEELIQLQKEAMEYKPDLVVLGYFVNDHYENLTCGLYSLQDGKLVRNSKADDPAVFLRDRLSRVPGYTFLCQHSYLVNALRNRASGFFRSKVGAKHQLEGASYTTDKPSEEQIALTCALVDEIIKTGTDDGAKVIVLNIPMEQNNAWMRNLPADRLKLKDKAVIVDVAAEIWNARPLRDIAHPGSYHPKPVGHELIADWLADHIQKKVW